MHELPDYADQTAARDYLSRLEEFEDTLRSVTPAVAKVAGCWGVAAASLHAMNAATQMEALRETAWGVSAMATGLGVFAVSSAVITTAVRLEMRHWVAGWLDAYWDYSDQ